MINFSSLLEFSHTYCIPICAVLVPLNLLATVQTLILIGLNRPAKQLWPACGFASLCALAMVLHVFSWFVVGVVRVPTFVLMALGGVCLTINLWAVLYPRHVRGVLLSLGRSLKTLRMGAASSESEPV